MCADLRNARVKTAIGNLANTIESNMRTREDLHGILREHGLDALQVGGAFVVVGGGESPLHGEGRQFKRLA